MSIINKVLKDLDNRQEHNAAPEGHGSAVAAEQPSGFNPTTLWGAGAVLVAAAAGFILYAMLADDKSSQPQSQSQQKQQQPSQAQPQQSADPASESAARPKPQPAQKTAQKPEPKPVTRQATTEPFQLPQPIVQPRGGANEQPSAQQTGQNDEPEPAASFNKQSVQLSAAEVAERSLQKAREAQRQGLFSDAAEHFAQTLQAQPQLHEARKEWAALEYGRGQLSRALSIVREGLTRNPDAHSLRLLAASMLQKSGQGSVARRLITQRQPEPSQLPQYYQFQAELAQQLNDRALMQQSYRALLQGEPDNGRWHLGLALALKQQDPGEALRLFEQAASLIEHQPTLEYIALQIEQLRSQHETPTP
ncbi:MAG: hypothetical protein ACQEQZ_08500 [Pseudomonadota bacterium]